MYEINKDVSKLGYLINKSDFEWYKWHNVYEMSNGLWHIIPFLEKEKINYRVDNYGHYMSIDMSNISTSRDNHFVYDGNYGLNSSVINKIFDDKIITTKVLLNNHIKVPKELLLIKSDSIFSNDQNDFTSLLKFTKQIHYPIICKPLNDMKGNGVIKINNDIELKQFWEKFDTSELGNRHYIAQQYIPWSDCRILYLDGEILVAYKRIPAHIIWDGTSTILTLIEKNNIFIENIQSISSYLYSSNHSMEDILKDKQILQILPTANISTWWTAKVITLSDEDNTWVKKIANIWWARYFWLDVMYDDNVKDWYVLEINKSPWVMGIMWLQADFANYFWQKILNAIKKTTL